MECRQHLGRPQLPPGALPAARRQGIQRGGHLPQPRQGRMGRHRRQQGGSAKLLPGHLPQGAPVDRPAEVMEALGHRRPRADRPMDLRPRHAARRRRPPDHPIHGAGRLHGAGRCGDAGRGAARLQQGLGQGARPLPALAHHAHRAHRAVGPRNGPPLPCQGRRAPGAQLRCGKAARRSASTTRWNGSTAGTSATASSEPGGSYSQGLNSARRLSADARWPPPYCLGPGIRGCRSSPPSTWRCRGRAGRTPARR
jgi:hypothetical protein